LGHAESPGDIPCSDSRIHGLMTAARVLRDQNSTMRTLGMHEHRLSRMYERAKAELASLQAERKERERRQFTNAALIRKHQKILKREWDPAENGFDFSALQLDRWNADQDMLDAAAQALKPYGDRVGRLR
jgi:hypothetical protein